MTICKRFKVTSSFLNIRGLRVALPRPERLPLAGCFPGPPVSQNIVDGAVAVAAPLAPDPRDRQSSWWCYKTGISPSLLVLAAQCQCPPSVRLSLLRSYPGGQAIRTSWEGTDWSVRPTVVAAAGCCYRCPLCRRRLAVDSLLLQLQDWWCVRAWWSGAGGGGPIQQMWDP